MIEKLSQDGQILLNALYRAMAKKYLADVSEEEGIEAAKDLHRLGLIAFTYDEVTDTYGYKLIMEPQQSGLRFVGTGSA